MQPFNSLSSESVQPSKDSLVYLASPYTHKSHVVMEQRFDQICRIAAQLMKADILLFCPISHTHPINVRGINHPGWDFWHRYDKVMMDACKGGIIVCTMHGWKESIGVTAEIGYMKDLERMVWYLDPDTMVLSTKEPE
jgi:hypothetical protein